jgi:hypothetical protein
MNLSNGCGARRKARAALDVAQPILRHAHRLGYGLKVHAAGFPRFVETGGDGSEANRIFDVDST